MTKSRLKPGPIDSKLIHVISDSTGNLARHMVAAFQTQFASGTFEVRPWNFIATLDRLQRTLAQVREVGGVVMHAMVSPKHKQTIEEFCNEHHLPCSDLTGQYVDFLSRASGVAPSANVKALHEVSDMYHRRIEAIEFTMQHDDGLGVERLREADVILVGVSRTSKTPTCIYLAQLGYKAANVAIAIEATVPAELLAMQERKVVGLVIDPWRLVEVRKTRSRSWNVPQSSYTEIEHVEREVLWSKQLFTRQGWPTLDVTKTAVEETAAKVVELLGLSQRTS